MKKTLTLEELAQYIGGKLWAKENISRIYLDLGYNTKKMSTRTYIYLNRDGDFKVSCHIECPSQHDNWIAKEETSIIESVDEQIAGIIEEHGIERPELSHQSAEVVMNNAILDAEPITGYYTEWRSVRIAINSYGKLATRNRQFVIAFKGTKNTAPRGFVELSQSAFDCLMTRRHDGNIGIDMLAPYEAIPDYEAIAIIVANRIEKDRIDRENYHQQLVAKESEEKILKEAAIQQFDILIAEGMDILLAWKNSGCIHPAPTDVAIAKKNSGLTWNLFIQSIK